ncbi:PBSX family phage terminase large subunit [Culicoidibacter larvae]|uniref:PBSX family phage terminase large subunit n=1 Tax=Culicoidibacter larvae TaxID=2579976 RepID=A0A5R8Q7H4_9FIRM|nr:PBSX family phage terminase large subunit [Culicoidibacter larvae]TLG71384.1 PBSX family phage terminase large subunit [Culicoidibacter larvae]
MISPTTKETEIKLTEIVGKGYGRFWKYKGRYRVAKGSRASKKSKTTALNQILRLKEYPTANLLVIRKTFRTLKDSCYSDLIWAARRLKLDAEWTFTVSPLEATNIHTGQKILFRGLDDPLKVTSISVPIGQLCWLWIEEGYEILSEEDFDKIDESIRGEGEVFKQITITMNPWNERHWIKARFFDVEDPDVMAITTNYLCNEFLDEADLRVFERMKKNNPRRYQVAGLGNWGIVDGLIFENWEEKTFDYREILKEYPNAKVVAGLDFGYTNDPSAFAILVIDLDSKQIWIFDEMYQKGMLNSEIYSAIESMGYTKEQITADSAEPKSIEELRRSGLNRIKGARKGKDSILNGIQFLQDFKIWIHPICVNAITEFSNYSWDKDKFEKVINKPVDDFNHIPDAVRYAVEDFIIPAPKATVFNKKSILKRRY